ncbi:MAG: transcription-repair coupling factor [Deltaproteobacteria bacterium]|nr:MAG: transcription-repair coupling factor [Deltaproteobacteria bacterium]
MTGAEKTFPAPERQGVKGVFEEAKRLCALLKSGEAFQLLGSEGMARSFTASLLWALSKGPVVVVLPDIKTRDRVAREIAAIRRLLEPSLKTPESAGILRFPSWELAPYMDEWMHPKVSALRVKGLHALLSGVPVAFLTTPEALLPRLPSPKRLREGFATLTVDMRIDDRDSFLRDLVYRGYTRVAATELPGDFSVRGGVVDLYSPVEDAPARLEWEGDEIVSLRVFDPVTQRTIRPITTYTIAPVMEHFPPLSVDEVQRKLYAREVPREGKKEIRRLIHDISRGESVENRIWLSPFLFDLSSDIFSYLPSKVPILWWDPEVCLSSLERTYDKIREEYDKRKKGFPLFAEPESLFLSPVEIEDELESHPLAAFGLCLAKGRELKPISVFEGKAFQPKDARDTRRMAWPVSVIARETRRLRGEGVEVWIAEASKKERQRLEEALLAEDLPLPVLPSLNLDVESQGGVVIGEIPEGFLLPKLRFALLSRLRSWTSARKTGPRPESVRVSDLAVFREGDPLVHLDYGIGLYRGLKHVDVLGRTGEFLVMEYAKGDKLFVPIDRLDAIQRYVGSGDAPPPLDTLGTPSWEKKKARLREDVAKIARELLELYATRKAVKGYAFGTWTEGLQEFEAAFPFQETPDQKKAIEDIYRDMTSEIPMDRLVCGDVGFGKTEVAMRAAFKAVMEGKQVAVLVPTTVLAEQHYVNFSQRFSPYPVRVELLSRFRSQAVQRAVVADLKAGKVDIVIGTHRLLQRDVKFRDLGLLIVDEEHRFGVTHKELLKKLSATVDVLTLTATPIPRTLQMSLSGLRDLSLINTPPRARLPISTRIARFRKDIIVEGIERELSRGGQVFFVHNRVKTIGKMTRLIQDLVPSATVAFAHGQMDERTLEDVMLAFMRREIDVLVCTTIIESGVDIPNVNTLFVHHAEQFGLSTLYQLRGRIGRSDRQAYAYFLIPHRAVLPKEAVKRLQSLQEFSTLGSGFKLAMMDLNMRGGGDLLGRRQSGRIAEVGFELYMNIIEEEVKKLKGQWVEPRAPVDLKLPFTMLIPEAYIPEMGLRLMFYRRLSKMEDAREVTAVAEELKDRFGPLPVETERLLEVVRLKAWLSEKGVTTLQGKENEIVIGFSEDSIVDRERLVTLIQEDPEHFRLAPSQKLVIRMKLPEDFDGYLQKVFSVLKQLLGYDKNSE